MEKSLTAKKVETIIVCCLLALVAVFAISVYSFVALGNARAKNAKYDEMISALEQQKASYEQSVEDIKGENYNTYLEELARNKYGMIGKGEKVYIYINFLI